MPAIDVTITNKLGLHARPASRLVQLTSGFPCNITIAKDGVEANAKSILGVLTLAAAAGTTLTVTAEGDRAEEALAAVRELFESGFDE